MVMCALLVCGASASAVRADEIEIVREGRSLAVIVLKPGAHAMERDAADDLRWAVREATGVRLEVLPEAPTASAKTPIRIGSQVALPSDTPYDCGEVRTGSGGVEIAGATPAGVANLVATILMEDFGVRMYYPEPQFTIVPRAKSCGFGHEPLHRDSPTASGPVWSARRGCLHPAEPAHGRAYPNPPLRLRPQSRFDHLRCQIRTGAPRILRPPRQRSADPRRDSGDTPSPALPTPTSSG